MNVEPGNSPGKREKAVFVTSQMGYPGLVDASKFMYNKKKTYVCGKEIWVCKESRSTFVKCSEYAKVQNGRYEAMALQDMLRRLLKMR